MPLYLPTFEVLSYGLIYFGALIIAFKDVLKICDESTPGYVYFDPGWQFVGKRRDNSDYEWEAWRLFLSESLWIFAVHVILMEILRNLKIKKFSIVSAILGNIFYIFQLGLPCAVFVFVKTVSVYWIAKRRRKLYVWLITFAWMGLNNMRAFEDFSINFLNLTDMKVYYFYVSLGWNSLKSISFVLDQMEDGDKGLHYTFTDYLGYVYYTPTLFIGPFVSYEKHRQMLLNFGITSGETLLTRVGRLVRTLIYLYLLFIFTQYALHYFYINNFQFYYKTILPRLSKFGLYGYGYLMGQIFHHKYVIFYGLSSAFGAFDNISMHKRPRCIARTHKYTDMWKYFDRGLYEFLFKYVYTQLSSKTSGRGRRLFAMSVTFIFIYLWHGFGRSIFVWSALNFICVLVESGWTKVTSSAVYNRKLRRYLGDNNILRLNALIGTNIMIPSILSNFIFFADIPVGLEFFKKTYGSGVGYYVKLWIFCYTIYCFSEFISRWEKQRSVADKDEKLKSVD